MDLVKTVTDDFVSAFRKRSDYQGPFARLVAMGCFPLCVDEDDPRVRRIVAKCAEMMDFEDEEASS